EFAEGPTPQVTLRVAAPDCAQLARRSIRCLAHQADPDCSLPVVEQRCAQPCADLRVPRQLVAFPADQAPERADPEGAVARHEQGVRLVGEFLPGRWLPRNRLNAIEAEQSEFATKPEIA